MAATTSKGPHRRSFSLKLLTVPDFSSFVVRSNSTISRRKNPRGQQPLQSGYPDGSSFVHPQDMHQQQLERQPTKQSRLYSFLTKSRSPSRSKNDSMADPPTPKSRSHATTRRSGVPMPVPGSKPPTRVQSRPLSSTTTATNTTLTPSTPKARRYPQPPIQKPLPVPIPNTERPTRDQISAKPRRRFQDLFSMSLGSLSRSRSRSHSRPGSPESLLDVPPLPTSPSLDDDSTTPRPRTSYSPHGPRRFTDRSPSPTPTGPKVLRVVNATATASSSNGSTAASIKITRLFTKNIPQSPVSPPLPVSQPLKRRSSLRRRSSLKEDESGSHHNLPRLIHTPATPLKDAGTVTPPKNKTRLGYQVHGVKGSLDSGLRYRAVTSGPAMGIVDEEGRSEVGSLKYHKGKAREGAVSPPLPPLPRPPAIRLSTSARSTKHGSFDFERPGWSGVGPLMMQRSGSGGTAGSGEMRERDNGIGPGMAGVGTLQRELSIKRGQEEQIKGRDREKRKPTDREKEKTSSQRTTPEHVHASTSTAGTNGTGPGKNSSLSKATGKRYTHAGKTGTGSSKLVGGHQQHGLFSFEPPVPTPTSWSTGTGGSTSTTGTGYGRLQDKEKTEREYERVQLEKAKEKERQKELKKRGLKLSGDRPPIPVPIPSIPSMQTLPGGRFSNNLVVGHRSGQKGRSLDLGLGLAWASSKVPEEALLPSSLFVRGLNNGRSTDNGTLSSSEHSSGRSGRRDKMGGDEVERSNLGREVAEVFRNVLDADGYRLFKQYVHQFDAHEIPFDGPNGIISLVETLLATSGPDLGRTAKKQLLDRFVKIILQYAGNTL